MTVHPVPRPSVTAAAAVTAALFIIAPLGATAAAAADPNAVGPVAMPVPELAQRGDRRGGMGGMGGGERHRGGKRERGDKDGDAAGETPEKPRGPMLDGETTRDALDRETHCGISRSRDCTLQDAIKRGMFETGLVPRFPDGLACRGIDEAWAIDYSGKRGREQYHGGIDMPAPWGTPMIAAAAGTVVAKYRGEKSFRGREIILRHSPADTGLPVWTYTQYAHFDAMPEVNVGDRVRMGQVLGPTGNSGIGRSGQQNQRRRPAIHFAVWYSDNPLYVALSRKIVPVDGWWMDPNAFYRGRPPFDSVAMKALPDAEKNVAIPVMLDDGTTVPTETKAVWPYTCTRK